MLTRLPTFSKEKPVLIAGPTASGKSAVALEIAAAQGREIVNADALQVFANWRVLTARPGPQEEEVARHRLYGHISRETPYSVGRWLREVAPLLQADVAPVIVGGTGLYFTALTEGLADIPPIPPEVRAAAEARLAEAGVAALVADLDAATRARIDTLNPMRVQRAWEVQRATGRGLAAWQDETPPPLLPLEAAETLLIVAERDWLNPRIERRFDAMLANGAIEEARANLPGWSPDLPAAKAIGAAELIGLVRGALTREQARAAAITATRQYAKRQRSWFRGRMKGWRLFSPG